MNTDDERTIEKLLKEAGRFLKRFQQSQVDAPPRVSEAIDRAGLAQAHLWKPLPAKEMEASPPTLQREEPIKAISAEEMKIEILRLLAARKSMDGVQIVAALRELRLALKDAGTGAVYGLLWDLEESGLLAVRVEPSESGIREYSITPNGRAQLQSPEPQSPQLPTLRLRTNTSTE